MGFEEPAAGAAARLNTATTDGVAGLAAADLGTASEILAEDRRHFDAAVRMVSDGASRWVIVAGVEDVDDLLRSGGIARRLGRVHVSAMGPNAVLVSRDEQPETATAGRARTPGGLRARVAAAMHALMSFGR